MTSPPAPLSLEPWEVTLILRLRQLSNQGQDWVKVRLKEPAILDYGRDKVESLTKDTNKSKIKTTDGA
jgi:hypothetical protein